MIHTWAWMIWLTATLAALSTTRNPLYLILILVCITFVSLALQRRGAPGVSIAFSPQRFILFVIGMTAVFNALTSHFGRTVLFHLPAKIPLFGGPITAEAMVYGATNGLVLAGLFIAFIVINQALPVNSLIRLIPRAYYPLAVVSSIALTFLPTTLHQFEQIREAQMIRGHRQRGVRDWLPLLMPLFVMGLERALQLAEAMTARGFASSSEVASKNRALRLCMAAGLLFIVGGWFYSMQNSQNLVAGLLLVGGSGLILGALWFLSRQTPRTTYQQEFWEGQDWLVLIGTIFFVLIFLMPFFQAAHKTLFYNPYPLLQLPLFDPLAGLGTIGLVVPAFLRLPQTT